MIRRINSRVLHAVDYDPATKTLVAVWLKKQNEGFRRVYRYEDVTQEQFNEMMGEGKEGHSIGSYFLKNIVRNHHAKRMEDSVETKEATPEAAPQS
jgi:KTSC domain